MLALLQSTGKSVPVLVQGVFVKTNIPEEERNLPLICLIDSSGVAF